MRPPPKAMSEYADTTALTRLQELACAPAEAPAPDPGSGESVSPQAFRALKAECASHRVRIRELESTVGRLVKRLGLGTEPSA